MRPLGWASFAHFYLGLYGSCDLPGVFESDKNRTDFFERHDYRPNDQILCYKKEITGFRPTPSRSSMRLRRSVHIDFASDPSARSWWDACTQGCLPQLSATVRSIGAQEIFAKALFWDMQTLTGPGSERSMGLSRLEMSDPTAPPETGKYLLQECFHYLQQQGIERVLGQCRKDDLSSSDAFEKCRHGALRHGNAMEQECRLSEVVPNAEAIAADYPVRLFLCFAKEHLWFYVDNLQDNPGASLSANP